MGIQSCKNHSAVDDHQAMTLQQAAGPDQKLDSAELNAWFDSLEANLPPGMDHASFEATRERVMKMASRFDQQGGIDIAQIAQFVPGIAPAAPLGGH